MVGNEAAPEQPEGAPIFRDPRRAAAADRATLAAIALDAVADIDKEIARAHARRAQILDNARVLAENAAKHLVLVSAPAGKIDELGYRAFVAETAAMLRIPESTARSQIAEARALQHSLPQTKRALMRGEISQNHAKRIIKQSWSLPPDAVAGYERAVVPAARVQTPATFGRTARVAREKLHPESIVDRHTAAHEGRCVDFQPLSDGMAYVGVTHTAELAIALYNATMEQAQSLQTATETRTTQQLAADVFVDAAVAGFVAPEPTLDTPPLPIPSLARAPRDGNSEREPSDDVGGYDSALLATAEAGLVSADIAVDGLSVTLGDSVTLTRAAAKRTGEGWHAEAPSKLGHRARPAPPLRAPLPADRVSGHTAIERAARVAVAEKPRRVERAATAAGSAGVREHPAAPEDRGLREALGVSARRRAIRPTVMVTVPALSLLGVTDEPANLDGYGPIDADTARELAANAPSFTRLLTHPETGAVVSVGRDTYRVPADLKRALQVRDGTCRFPGCNRKAIRCDVDHTKDWQHGGETAMTNLAHLCRMHHTLKHLTHWSVEQDATGTLTWTGPSGRTFVTEPDIAVGSARDPYGASPPF